MQTEMLTYATPHGDTRGYRVAPDGDGPWPGVVVIQEWWGLNAHIQDITARLAAEGFVTLAPDLYHGVVATEPDEARKQAMNLDRPRAVSEIDAAVEALRADARVSPKQIGVVGFCMGGGLTLMVAARNPQVGAAVAFYGGFAPAIEDFTNTSVAILNIVGEDDENVKKTQRKLETDLRMTPIQHDLVIYPGAGHAFMNDTRPEAYNLGAATDAWTRTVDWLRSHLV
jgi:carboxymethylenebutenolidase